MSLIRCNIYNLKQAYNQCLNDLTSRARNFVHNEVINQSFAAALPESLEEYPDITEDARQFIAEVRRMAESPTDDQQIRAMGIANWCVNIHLAVCTLICAQ